MVVVLHASHFHHAWCCNQHHELSCCLYQWQCHPRWPQGTRGHCCLLFVMIVNTICNLKCGWYLGGNIAWSPRISRVSGQQVAQEEHQGKWTTSQIIFHVLLNQRDIWNGNRANQSYSIEGVAIIVMSFLWLVALTHRNPSSDRILWRNGKVEAARRVCQVTHVIAVETKLCKIVKMDVNFLTATLITLHNKKLPGHIHSSIVTYKHFFKRPLSEAFMRTESWHRPLFQPPLFFSK